ncbi:hypothetical protein AB4Y85_01310 [Microvirga sp. 2YAF29]
MMLSAKVVGSCMTKGKLDCPQSTWVGKARAVVMFVGFAWVPGLMIYGMFKETDHGRDFTFMMIGIMFTLSMMIAPILICSVLLPTHTARLLGLPLVLLACFVFLAVRTSSNINYPSLIGFVPWVITGTAIVLVLPELSFVSRLYSRIFGLLHTRSP